MSHGDVPTPNAEELLERLQDLLTDPRDAFLERQMKYLRKIENVEKKYGEDKKNGDS